RRRGGARAHGPAPVRGGGRGEDRRQAGSACGRSGGSPPEMTVTATEPLIASGPVLLALDGAVARLRLNRPEASNGLDVPLPRALHEAVLRCHSDPRVRAVLLSGEGKHFCAGGDVRTFASKGERLPEYLREATAWLQASAAALMRLEAPVVAMVHGYAAGGGGFGLVCASDMVIAAESARFLLGATR